MIIGYARVSTKEQNLNRQIEELEKYGCEKIFIEKQSGKNFGERTVYQEMRSKLRFHDVLVVHDLSRFGRNKEEIKNEWWFCMLNIIYVIGLIIIYFTVIWLYKFIFTPNKNTEYKQVPNMLMIVHLITVNTFALFLILSGISTAGFVLFGNKVQVPTNMLVINIFLLIIGATISYLSISHYRIFLKYKKQ